MFMSCKQIVTLVSLLFQGSVLFDFKIIPPMRTFYQNYVVQCQLETVSGQMMINNNVRKTLHVIFYCGKIEGL